MDTTTTAFGWGQRAVPASIWQHRGNVGLQALRMVNTKAKMKEQTDKLAMRFQNMADDKESYVAVIELQEELPALLTRICERFGWEKSELV